MYSMMDWELVKASSESYLGCVSGDRIVKLFLESFPYTDVSPSTAYDHTSAMFQIYEICSVSWVIAGDKHIVIWMLGWGHSQHPVPVKDTQENVVLCLSFRDE